MKHRKGEKIIFCEDTDDKVMQSGSSDILMINEKDNDNAENEGVFSQKESSNIKDKKSKAGTRPALP